MAMPASRPAPSRLLDARARASYAWVLPVLRRLREAGHQAYLVGGGVRDLLRERPVGDWDVTTSARPEAVLELWPDAVPTGIRHGTVTLILDRGHVEVTTYRVEGPYADGRRPDWVRFDAGLTEDLSRRDFTVNAMALDPEEGLLIDPHGGLRDLEAGVLRTVGDPDRRFDEDGLRPLRGARFAAALELEVEPATLAAMGRAADRVRQVAAERVRAELIKLMRAPRPSVGVDLLRRTGLLEGVLPELLEGVGMEQNRYHAYDVYEHSLRAMDAAPADRPLLRLAALLHDVGKPRTRRVVDGEGTFHNHQHLGAAMARDILDRLRFSRAERDGVAHLVEEHMFHYTPDWTDGAVRRFLRRVGPEAVGDLFRLRLADDAAHGPGGGSRSAQVLDELDARIRAVRARDEALSVKDLAVGGREIMAALGIPAGPEVGRLLERLLERVLEDPELNTREALLEIAVQERSRLDDP